MSDSAADSPRRRRAMVRRTRGLHGSGSTGREGVTFRSVSDSVDDIIDPEVEMERRPAPPTVPRLPDDRVTHVSAGDDDGLGNTPSARLASIGNATSGSYAKEYRLNLLHRLMMRGYPMDRIAGIMNVSLSTVMRDKKELMTMLRGRSQQLNVDELIGNQLAFYDDVTGNVMRIMDQSSTSEDGRVQAVPVPMRLAAARTAMTAQADKVKLLQATGVLDSLRFRQGEGSGAMTEIQALMQLTNDLLANGADPEGFGELEFSENEEDMEL